MEKRGAKVDNGVVSRGFPSTSKPGNVVIFALHAIEACISAMLDCLSIKKSHSYWRIVSSSEIFVCVKHISLYKN